MKPRFLEQLDSMIFVKRMETALIEQHKKWFDYEKGGLKKEYAEPIACPVCDRKNAELRFQKDLFRFDKCRDCGMTYLNPRLNIEATYQFYNDPWTSVYNESKFSHDRAETVADDTVNAYNLKWIERHRGALGAARGKFLEIGFGGGYLLETADKAGYEVYGIDVDRSNCERVAKKFGDRIQNKDIFAAAYPADTFEIVYMRDVFEHVPNPRQLLQEVNRILKKGGLVFIETLNSESLIYKIVKQRHTCVFGFAHLNYWSPQTLREVLKRTGFDYVDEEHTAADCTAGVVSEYFLSKKFTMIAPIPAGRFAWLLAALTRTLLSFSIFRRADNKLTPKLAAAVKQGSEVKFLGRKT